jgi:hypothetical protein
MRGPSLEAGRSLAPSPDAETSGGAALSAGPSLCASGNTTSAASCCPGTDPQPATIAIAQAAAKKLALRRRFIGGILRDETGVDQSRRRAARACYRLETNPVRAEARTQ